MGVYDAIYFYLRYKEKTKFTAYEAIDMKTNFKMTTLILTALLSVLSFSSFANDCDTYGKKLVACYEFMGEFEEEYDTNRSSSRCSLFRMQPSRNISIQIETTEANTSGSLTTSRCNVEFFNRNGDSCEANFIVEVDGNSKNLFVMRSSCR